MPRGPAHCTAMDPGGKDAHALNYRYTGQAELGRIVAKQRPHATAGMKSGSEGSAINLSTRPSIQRLSRLSSARSGLTKNVVLSRLITQ